MRAKITQIGNSMGMIIPKELITAMNLKKGEEVFLTPTKDGFTITHYDEEIERQMDVVAKYAKKYRNTLRKLAD
ncbi:MAG: AbrB/MazE/SpoVT family DNA-binding domain-containing protein [Bdellovibrionales bacterium]|jgi:putative addiction module antidote